MVTDFEFNSIKVNPNHIFISKRMDASDLGQLTLPSKCSEKIKWHNDIFTMLYYAVQCLPQLPDTNNFSSSRSLLSVRCRVHMKRCSDHICVFHLYSLQFWNYSWHSLAPAGISLCRYPHWWRQWFVSLDFLAGDHVLDLWWIVTYDTDLKHVNIWKKFQRIP